MPAKENNMADNLINLVVEGQGGVWRAQYHRNMGQEFQKYSFPSNITYPRPIFPSIAQMSVSTKLSLTI